MVRAEAIGFSVPNESPHEKSISSTVAIFEAQYSPVLLKEMDVYNLGMESSGGIEILAEQHSTPEVSHEPFNKIIILSNRLPAAFIKDEQGNEIIKPTVGGLGHAIHAYTESVARKKGESPDAVRDAKLMWIGWDGSSTETEGLEEGFAKLTENGAFDMGRLHLTKKEVHDYYNSISNRGFWPLFHNQLEHFEFNMEHYDTYKKVNKRWARTVRNEVAKDAQGNDFIWVQDYHLMLAGKYMKEAGVQQKMGFFLHIPFPSPDTFAQLPEQAANELVDGLLSYNIVGFQTDKDRDNFIATAEERIGAKKFVNEKGTFVKYNDRTIRVDTYPISIDPKQIQEKVNQPKAKEMAEKILRVYGKNGQGEDRVLFFDAHRNDPTKGAIPGLLAFEKYLTEHPEMRRRAVFIRAVAPSRGDVPAYGALYKRVGSESERINKKFQADAQGTVIKLFDKGMPYDMVLAFLSAIDVAATTTEIDGMNLIAKEAPAAGKHDMVAILGAGAGASHELKDAAIIVPIASDDKSINTLSQAMNQAVTMQREEKIDRKKRALEIVETNDVYKWATRYLNDATAA